MSATVTVSATAADNIGVVGVQFRLDGVNLGAEDIQIHGDTVEIVTLPENFSEVAEGLEQAGVTIDMKQIMRIPATTVELDAETAKAVLKLLENLEDHDDVQSVSTNLRLTAEVLSE